MWGDIMENEFLKSMGKRVCARRKQLNITQEQLAEQMDVSIQMISNLENGRKAIRPENLVKLSDILQTSSDYLLTGKSSDTETAHIYNKIKKLSDNDLSLIEAITDRLTGK